jgi:murein DD-endopeptidase MepM/ murein hydrolase activator NlpD
MLLPSRVALVALLVLGAGGSAPPLPSATTAAAGWVWPVDGQRHVVRPFLAPPTPYGLGHRGVDLAASGAGVEVRAVTSGVVHFAGVVVDRPVVTVRQGQVLATVEPVEPLVAAGDLVQSGDVIGVLLPGHCGRPCVHLGVRVTGEYVSPLLWLGGVQRAVLVPLGDAAGEESRGPPSQVGAL